MQALGILREADAEIGVGERVVGRSERGTGGDAHARVAHQIRGEAEAVAQAVDAQEAVEGALRRNPADAVLCVHKAARHLVARAATFQHEGTEFVTLR